MEERVKIEVTVDYFKKYRERYIDEGYDKLAEITDEMIQEAIAITENEEYIQEMLENELREFLAYKNVKNRPKGLSYLDVIKICLEKDIEVNEKEAKEIFKEFADDFKKNKINKMRDNLCDDLIWDDFQDWLVKRGRKSI
jgi:hypothetical protein